MKETRYIVQGGTINGKAFEIVTKEEPEIEYCGLFNILYGAKKIRVYKAELEFIKEMAIDEDKKWTL